MSLQPNFQGVHDQDIVDNHELIRPHKPMLVLAHLALNNPLYLGSILIIFSIVMFIMPATLFYLFPLSLIIYAIKSGQAKKEHLPISMPMAARQRVKYDYGEPKPGRQSYEKPNGLFYIGNEMITLKQLWAAKKHLMTHMLILGTTGAGKTETMLSLAMNFLGQGGGLIYTDAKGSPKFIAQMFYMCRMVGQEDNFRFINFMQSANLSKTASTKRMSNSINPLYGGDADDSTQIMNSLIEVSSDGGNAVFGQNAQTMMKSLMFGMKALHNSGQIILSMLSLRDYMNADKMISLLEDSANLPDVAYKAISAFMVSMGYQAGAKQQQPQMYTQFGFARAYFNMAISTLADSYGDVFGVERGEVDIKDVILNGRVSICLIPSMKKSPEETKNLGKIILSQVKIAAAQLGLGNQVEGTVSEVVESLATNGRTQFAVMTDEYAAIAMDGFEVLATQLRSMNISTIIGNQDYAGLAAANEKQAKMLVANMKLKFLMAQEDPKETMELAKQLAGDVMVNRTEGRHIDKDGAGLDYRDQMQAKSQSIARIDYRDLAKQLEGEAHLFTNGTMIRLQMYYANMDPPSDFPLQLVELPFVSRPSYKDLDARIGDTRIIIESLKQRLTDPNHSLWDSLSESLAIPSSDAKAFELMDTLLEKPNNDSIATSFMVFTQIEGSSVAQGHETVKEMLNELSASGSDINTPVSFDQHATQNTVSQEADLDIDLEEGAIDYDSVSDLMPTDDLIDETDPDETDPMDLDIDIEQADKQDHDAINAPIKHINSIMDTTTRTLGDITHQFGQLTQTFDVNHMVAVNHSLNGGNQLDAVNAVNKTALQVKSALAYTDEVKPTLPNHDKKQQIIEDIQHLVGQFSKEKKG